MADLANLTPEKRADYYRELAMTARRDAELSDSPIRDFYGALAEHWEKLALAVTGEIWRYLSTPF